MRGDAPVKTFEDLFDKELVVGASAGREPLRARRSLMLRNVLGAKFKIVAGYPGTREINLAIERNEVQGGCGQTWSSVTSLYKQAFAEGRIKAIVGGSAAGSAELNKMGVPLAQSSPNRRRRGVLGDLLYQLGGVQTSIMWWRWKCRRIASRRCGTAFMATMKDRDLVAEAEKMQVDADPVSGEELQKKVEQIYATPADVVEKTRKAVSD